MPWYAVAMIVVLAMSAGANIVKNSKDNPGVGLAVLVTNVLMIWGIVALANSACY